MKADIHDDHIVGVLQKARLRLTRQRLQVAALLFDDCHKHVTAEQIHAAANNGQDAISLATVYNTLHQFTAAGLLRQVMIDSNRIYFDTNTADHHHFFAEGDGHLSDVPAESVVLSRLPKIPAGCTLDRVDVVIRLKADKK